VVMCIWSYGFGNFLVASTPYSTIKCSQFDQQVKSGVLH
jgi:hypothetical protein